jgi:hypothetical protein
MSAERPESNRHRAQQRLAAAQDKWIEAVEKHGHDLNHPEVLGAHKELEAARLEYLKAIRS